MKRKGARAIPDFSSKRKSSTAAEAPSQRAQSVVVPRGPAIKPQSTSAKSGRRGQ